MRVQPLVLALVLGLVAWPVSSLAAPAGPARLFPEDAALTRHVTVQRGRVYLGELLEQLSRETRVPLAVESSKGPLDGVLLAAYIKERPLREVLAGLQELLTHRYHRCEWRRVGKQYTLFHYPSLEEAAAAARQAVAKQWGEDVRTFYAAAKMSAEERALQARERRDLFPGGHLPAGNLDLFGRLTPTQVDILAQGAAVELDAARLTGRDQETLNFGLPAAAARSAGAGRPPSFRAAWDPNRVGPVLWLDNGQGSATNVVGGSHWDALWVQRQGDGWRTGEDPEVRACFYQRSQKDPAAGSPFPTPTLAHWLRHVSLQQALNVIADRVEPGPGGTLSSGWLGRNPEQTFFALIFDLALVGKQVGGLYLLRGSTAMVHPRRHLVPWKQVAGLRRTAEAGEGYLDLPGLLELSALTPDQRAGLVEEFPDAAREAVGQWRPIFQSYANLTPESQAQVRKAEGLPLRDTGLAARGVLLEGPDPGNLRGLKLMEAEGQRAVVHLRLEQGKIQVREPPRRIAGELVPGRVTEREGWQVVWEVRVPDGPTHRRTLALHPRRPLKPE